MKIGIEIGKPGAKERHAEVLITAEELSAAYLHLAFPERRNRTGLYMRRHSVKSDCHTRIDTEVGPNKPLRSPDEPPKLTITDHIRQMREASMLPNATSVSTCGPEGYGEENTMLAVPISDLVANLMRPCYHRDGLGKRRVFFFEDEPINLKEYWCACFFSTKTRSYLDFKKIRFDIQRDCVFDSYYDRDLTKDDLVWAVALVPLVVNGTAASIEQIAQNDYDLSHVFGLEEEHSMLYAYEGWFGEWDQRVESLVQEHSRKGIPFATYYHSILGLDKDRNVRIFQMEGTLPELAGLLVQKGVVDAGILDSGGSCSLYDIWMANYLNHSWYYRESRGSILVFELTSRQRIPKNNADSWINRKEQK